MPLCPPSSQRLCPRACRRVLGYSALGLLAATLFLDVVVDHWPRLYDPEFGRRLELLRQRIAETPHRPVLVFVGSSRVGLGFHPEQMPEVRAADGRAVLAFNGSHLAGGPTMSLVVVKRLLRAGVRPRWVVVELAPFIMTDECTSTPTTNACAADLPTLFRHVRASKVAMVYVRSRLNPWYKHRQTLLEKLAPRLAASRPRHQQIRLGRQGGDDFWYHPATLPPQEVRRLTYRVLAEDGPRLHDYRIAQPTDRAMRDLLELCRDKGIGVTVVMMPESNAYRALYSADAERTVTGYAASLERTFGVPVIDARAWLPDDSFSDGNHLFRPAGVAFTRRLAVEVLQPLVEGRLRARPRQNLPSRTSKPVGLSSVSPPRSSQSAVHSTSCPTPTRG